MKNQKETKQDELAAIGIGAMIVFIALILVAAVAAAVIIQTAEKLQQNAQASGDETQAQMSTKVTLINIVIESRSLGADNAIGGTAGNADTAELFVTFELAPGSEPTMSSDVGYTVICENLGDDGAVGGAAANADTTAFDQGDLTVATAHTGNGRTGDTTATPAGTIANPVAQTLNPGSTYVAVLQINDCIPVSNTDHVAIFTVDGGGNTYEELQYGSSPSLGDVVV
jgi:flagellin FlaB